MPRSKPSPITSSDAHAATKPKRSYRTADQWREIVAAFQCSNLTRAEFCKQRGIATSGLYNWQRKFEQENVSPPRKEDTFVEIQTPVLSSRASNQTWDVELELGHGRVLRVRVA